MLEFVQQHWLQIVASIGMAALVASLFWPAISKGWANWHASTTPATATLAEDKEVAALRALRTLEAWYADCPEGREALKTLKLHFLHEHTEPPA